MSIALWLFHSHSLPLVSLWVDPEEIKTLLFQVVGVNVILGTLNHFAEQTFINSTCPCKLELLFAILEVGKIFIWNNSILNHWLVFGWTESRSELQIFISVHLSIFVKLANWAPMHWVPVVCVGGKKTTKSKSTPPRERRKLMEAMGKRLSCCCHSPSIAPPPFWPASSHNSCQPNESKQTFVNRTELSFCKSRCAWCEL